MILRKNVLWSMREKQQVRSGSEGERQKEKSKNFPAYLQHSLPFSPLNITDQLQRERGIAKANEILHPYELQRCLNTVLLQSGCVLAPWQGKITSKVTHNQPCFAHLFDYRLYTNSRDCVQHLSAHLLTHIAYTSLTLREMQCTQGPFCSLRNLKPLIAFVLHCCTSSVLPTS